MRDTASEVLVLAHHMNDQAETVLMHLLYGAGSTGLGGMKPFSNGVWRPFLGLKREVLQEYLRLNGYEWREDESNSDTNFTRNRIRAQVMPVIEECAPEAAAAIARTARIVRDEDQLLDALSDAWMAENAANGENCFLKAQALAGEHTALQRRIIRKCAGSQGILLDFEQTERVRNLLNAKSGSSENLPGGGIAFKGDEYLHFLPQGWNPEKQCNLSQLLICEGCSEEKGNYEQPLPQNQIQGLHLRTRLPGDYIRPFGMKGTKPLKEYMIERGIERPFRSSWPIVCRGNEVLWVIGVGASEKLRVKSMKAPEYKLIYTGKLPDQL
jgi:tRNA(Ile)-lysidine synthase